MKKIVLSICVSSVLLFTGCSNNNLVVQTSQKVEKATNNLLAKLENNKLIDSIDKRYLKNGVWHYHLRKNNITLVSSKKYYYLYDLVDVTFDGKNRIKNIKKLKTGVIKQESKTPSKPIENKVVVKSKPIEKTTKREVIKDRLRVAGVKEINPVINKKEISNERTVAKADNTAELKKDEDKNNSFW